MDPYKEYLDELQDRASQVTHWASEQARCYRRRVFRRMRDKYGKIIEDEIRSLAKKTIAELIEETLPNMFRERNDQQSEARSSSVGRGSKVQRVPIEYDKIHDPFEDSSPDAEEITPNSSLPQYDRPAQRRTILESLRTGTISLEEAEHRLNDLG